MEFQFAKATEVTDLAFDVNPEYKRCGYMRIFICPDVNDFWILRILNGYDEDYNHDPNSFTLEKAMVSKANRYDKLTLEKAAELLRNDDLENWEYSCSSDLKELINMIDGGFGILNLKQ